MPHLYALAGLPLLPSELLVMATLLLDELSRFNNCLDDTPRFTKAIISSPFIYSMLIPPFYFQIKLYHNHNSISIPYFIAPKELSASKSNNCHIHAGYSFESAGGSYSVVGVPCLWAVVNHVYYGNANEHTFPPNFLCTLITINFLDKTLESPHSIR